MNRRPMRNALCTLALALSVAATLHADDTDFAERLQKAKADHDAPQSAAILDEWKRARPDDPEYYIAAANDLLDRDAGVVISTKKAEPGDFVVTDQKTGRAVGSVAQGMPSPETNRQAVELLKQGLAKAPARMDIYLGLATLYERLNDSEALLADLSEMAAYANAHPDAVLGRGGRPYPTPVDENLSHQINDIAHHYFARETEADNRTFHELAKLDAEAFPNVEYGYNLLGVYYSAIEVNSKLALENYEQALKIVPDDSLVWINVGVVHGIAGEKEEAVAAFKKVVALNNDAGCVQQAKAELAKLRGPAKKPTGKR